MKEIVLSVILLITAIVLYGQSNAEERRPTINQCPSDSLTAIRDINTGKPKVFCFGGFAPRAFTKEDEAFERKYKITYIQMGCTPMPFPCSKSYNEVVAKHLDAIYGKGWREAVRKDAVAILRLVAPNNRFSKSWAQ
jgi:hypothetical protein